jgi:Nif-specific regulatory protein
MSAQDLGALSVEEAGDAVSGGSRHLTLLTDVARALGSGATAEESIQQVLRVLDRRLGARRSVIHGLEAEPPRMFACLSHGMTRDQWSVRYGRGIAGSVAETGRACAVARVELEPAACSELAEPFAWSAPPWSLLCVPLILNRRVVGTLSTYLRQDTSSDNALLLDLLEVVASLLAPIVGRFEAPAPGSVSTAEVSDALDSKLQQEPLIGRSPAMRPIHEAIAQVAPTNATVLIRGQSGAGKELVAQAIHRMSSRTQRAFVKVNCAALPDSLFESEVFGYERGAFTGAASRKQGRFEMAAGGTLFLDEIGELSLTSQAKLLRVLQFREFERLGGVETITTDARIVAATNKDLEQAVGQGTFREDLYYRLNVFMIQLPTLRQRQQDIGDIAEHFITRFAQAYRRPALELSREALDALLAYPFPGNVRELENVIERAVVVCEGPTIQLRHLPETVRDGSPGTWSSANTLADAVSALERRMITEALERAGGSAARAAVALGTTERVLRYKVTRYKIGRPRPR